MSVKFKGLIAPTEVPTGDGRMFATGKATHRPLPIPLMAQFGSGGHSGATPVGNIEKIYPGPGGYWGEGSFFDPTIVPEVPRAVYMMQKKALGPSVDLDRDYTVKAMPHPTRPDKKVGLFNEYNIIGATLVPMPAFHQVHMSVVDSSPTEMSLLASAGVDFTQFIHPESFDIEFGMEELLGDLLQGGPLSPNVNEDPGPPVLIPDISPTDPVSAPPMAAPNTTDLPFAEMPLATSMQGLLGPMGGGSAAGPSKFAPDSMGLEGATSVASILQKLLFCHTNFFLTLKQAHWNVVGPAYIGVHRLIDEWAEMAEDMADQCAERVATLGASPTDMPAAMVASLDPIWTSYSLGKSDTQNHLRALDSCFTYLVTEIRKAISLTQNMDPITQNLLLDQGTKVEHQQWFLRAHLENNLGELIEGTVVNV